MANHIISSAPFKSHFCFSASTNGYLLPKGKPITVQTLASESFWSLSKSTYMSGSHRHSQNHKPWLFDPAFQSVLVVHLSLRVYLFNFLTISQLLRRILFQYFFNAFSLSSILTFFFWDSVTLSCERIFHSWKCGQYVPRRALPARKHNPCFIIGDPIWQHDQHPCLSKQTPWRSKQQWRHLGQRTSRTWSNRTMPNLQVSTLSHDHFFKLR